MQLFVLATDATRSIRYEKQDEAIWSRNEKDTSSDESCHGIRKSSENTLQIPINRGSLNFYVAKAFMLLFCQNYQYNLMLIKRIVIILIYYYIWY